MGLGEHSGHQQQKEQTIGQKVYCKSSPTAGKKLSPSKMRRRARRAAARSSTAESVVGNDTLVKEKDAGSQIDKDVATAARTQESHTEPVVNNVSSLPEQYACNQCDFISSWDNGLNVHVSVMHEISLGPLDVPKTDEDRKVHELAQSYWKSGILANNFQVYIKALKDVEKANVDDNVKETEERKLEELWKEVNRGMHGVKLDSFPS